MIGAGTNNARLAGMLRGLSSYFYKEPGMLFLVRVSQGLVHLGKGLLGLSPHHTDGQLLNGACAEALITAISFPFPPPMPWGYGQLALSVHQMLWMKAHHMDGIM